MPSYFDKFPKIDYEFRYLDSNNQEVFITSSLTNITVKLGLTSISLDNEDIFFPYQWKEEDRLDTFSEQYYGNQDLFWLVSYAAERFDVFNEFPKTERVFYKYMYKKYREAAIEAGFADTVDEVIRYTKQTIDSYQDGDGDFIDEETFINDSSPNKKINFIFDIEAAENESLRTINVVSSTFQNQIRKELEETLNQLNKDLELGSG